MGKYEESLSDFDRAIELDPEYQGALTNRGETYLQMGKYEEALSDFGRAIEIDPEDEWALAQRGLTYRQMGKYEESLSDFDRAIELDPEYELALASRGETYLEMDAARKAKPSFQLSARIDDKNDWPNYMLYLCSLKLDEVDEEHLDLAISLSKETLEKEENNHRVRFNLALYQLVQGGYDTCQETVEEALNKGANLHHLSGFSEDLQFFLKLFPHAKPVQQMLAWAEEKKSSLAD